MKIALDQARAIALRAQGFGSEFDSVAAVLQHLGAVQLDTISVLARSHELVPRARVDATTEQILDTYWRTGSAFEYWSHAASVVPMASWPLYSFRRRHYLRKYADELQRLRGERQRVVRRLRAEGPLTATALGGAKAPGTWWSWSDTKHVLEILLATGQVATVSRTGWRREYALTEQVIPQSLRSLHLSDRECQRRLVEQAGHAMGIATIADLADYPRLKQAEVKEVLASTSLIPVSVEGWKEAAWLHPDFLNVSAIPSHAPVLLSPFDSLIWSRKRTERVFGYRHKLEIYVPKADRHHGYFTTPVLAGGAIVGMVDPKRDGHRLLIQNVVAERSAMPAVVHAVERAAHWVGATQVVGLPGTRRR